ncbi:MAG: hypothetical protein AABZ07_00630 [Nitrospirota bacterium]
MDTSVNIKQKRCVYCKRFFRPDSRVGARQKSCKEKECQKKRKAESQKMWVESNAGYFQGRYAYVREWRMRNPDYQRQWRATRRDEIQDEMPLENPVKTVRLAIPERWLSGEIQDEIRLVRHCECGVFVAGGLLQDTRQDCLL